MANKLEQATLVAYSELKELFESPSSKRNEKRISKLTTIINFLNEQIAQQKQISKDEVQAYFWDKVHGNI